MGDKRQKILFIIESMGGGVFTYIVDLANELINTYDMHIAYAVRSQTPTDYRSYFDKRIHLIEVNNLGRSINPKKDIKAFLEIQRIAKKVKPDIIHLHSSKAGVLGRLAFNGHKIPMFYTPHGYSFLMENHSLAKRYMYKTIEAVCGKCYCTTISCSEGEHQESLKLTKHTAYVNNGINTNDLQELIESVDVNKKNPFTVFTLGRICHQKNPKLFNEVALRMPDVNFVWIGDGELRGTLTASNIKITGWVERKEALRYSLQGDVFILTSLWEGLPLSLLEAMYMKKFCVVSNVIGNRDVIQNDFNGFVCDSVEDFVKGIRIVQIRESNILLENAYQDVLNKYNTKVMAEKYRENYTIVLS